MAEFDEISAFVAVVRHGGFSAGAKALGQTRSGVGKAVARLEASLGTRLLNRTTRSVGVTVEGEEFYNRCVAILAELKEAKEVLRRRTSEPEGILRIALPNAYGRIRILPILQRYLKDWPSVSAEILFTKHMIDMHEEGIDLAVRIGGVLPESRVIVRTIARERAKLYASPAYISSRGTPLTTDDLRDHDLIFFGNRYETDAWNLRSEDGALTTLNKHARYRADSGEAVLDGAIGGLGIAYLPTFLARPGLDEKRLVPVLPSLTSDVISIYALYPSSRLTPKVRMLVDRLVQDLSE